MGDMQQWYEKGRLLESIEQICKEHAFDMSITSDEFRVWDNRGTVVIVYHLGGFTVAALALCERRLIESIATRIETESNVRLIKENEWLRTQLRQSQSHEGTYLPMLPTSEVKAILGVHVERLNDCTAKMYFLPKHMYRSLKNLYPGEDNLYWLARSGHNIKIESDSQ